MTSSSRVPWFARVTAASSQFANRHGVYIGPRCGRLHVVLYRLSRGRLGGHLPGWPAARILLLDHIGARSGVKRTSPLMFYAEGDVLSVVASKAGQPTHPAWYHNLMAHPDTSVQIGGAVRPVRARRVTEAERERLWPQFVAFYPGYEFYARQASGRRIPIVILDPRPSLR